ncbi:GatB/YqeY domain-containing protein [Gammaproteobacteria bacterium]|nr:GatB/YqeY domain-containing protein [Gammaproteobacteria bacterium]
MSLLSDIQSDLKQAMLGKDELTRDTLRMFKAEVQKFEIDSKETVDDARALQVINKMIKQRNDSISQFTNGGRIDLAEKEQSEVDVLSKYKPKQLDESEITTKVNEAISESEAAGMQDIGKVMGILKKSIEAGTADMGIVSKIVKDQLS